MSIVLSEITDELLSIFDSARRVAVLTGAGVSAESGVPTFRGGGDSNTWTWRGRPVYELSSAELIAADPKLVWEWFDYRRALLKECVPNAGHDALAK
ncbi:MAG TPA: Sir2 family NAD-dependent protein deacetylase, partial [Blastocatellia bacterium]|nr:Sir2 family NAD-dependent protein deacetylase [Blastocatellia bacterium]